MKKRVFIINNIEEYGKFVAFCIEHDISVFRLFWDERAKGERCFEIDWLQRSAFYSSRDFYEGYDCEISIPEFTFNEYGVCVLTNALKKY